MNKYFIILVSPFNAKYNYNSAFVSTILKSFITDNHAINQPEKKNTLTIIKNDHFIS